MEWFKASYAWEKLWLDAPKLLCSIATTAPIMASHDVSMSTERFLYEFTQVAHMYVPQGYIKTSLFSKSPVQCTKC